MRSLGLDVGGKRTGVAFFDDDIGVVLPLKTIVSSTPEHFLSALSSIISARQINRIVVGLPLLPSGREGEQAARVRSAVTPLVDQGIPVVFIDERYTTPPTKHRNGEEWDGDAVAACCILQSAFGV